MNKFITVKEASIKWNVSERSVRNYCSSRRVEGAVFDNGIWKIPLDAKKPSRTNEKENKNYLLERLREEKKLQIKGGIYHKLQIDLTYNSNHMEGSKLTHEQTRYIYETRTIGFENEKSLKVDDIIETINHFAMIDRTETDRGMAVIMDSRVSKYAKELDAVPTEDVLGDTVRFFEGMN